MKQDVIKEFSLAELKERLEEEMKQLIKLKLNHAISPLENPNKINSYRRTIARMKTDLRKRQLEEQAKQA